MIRQLNEDEINDVLSENILGRIGCTDNKKVYVVPTNYVFDGRAIIAHSLVGEKIRMMRKNPSVCFEVDEMKTLTQWKSVILWGEYQEINDESARYSAMKLFADRMLRLKISDTVPVTPDTIHPGMHDHNRSVVYRIFIIEKTGRYENR